MEAPETPPEGAPYPHQAGMWLMMGGILLMICAILGIGGTLAFLAVQRATQDLPGLAATSAVSLKPTPTPKPAGPDWPLVLQDDFSAEAYDWQRGDFPGRFADGRLGGKGCALWFDAGIPGRAAPDEIVEGETPALVGVVDLDAHAHRAAGDPVIRG